MSSVSPSLPLSPVEPVQRRRAGEAASDRSTPAFTLPEAPRPETDRPARSEAARDDSATSRQDAATSRQETSPSRQETSPSRQETSSSRQEDDDRANDQKSGADRSKDAKSDAKTRSDGPREDRAKAAADGKADAAAAKPAAASASAAEAAVQLAADPKAVATATTAAAAPLQQDAAPDANALFLLAVSEQAGGAATKDDSAETDETPADASATMSAETPVQAVASQPDQAPVPPAVLLLGQGAVPAIPAGAMSGADGKAQGVAPVAGGPPAPVVDPAMTFAAASADIAADASTAAAAKPDETKSPGKDKKGELGEAQRDAASGPFAKDVSVDRSGATPAQQAQAAEMQQVANQPSPGAAELSALLSGGKDRHEAVTGAGAAAAAHAGTATSAATPGATPTTPPTPLHMVPMEIGLRSLTGSKRFEIRLDPAELGRIDVSLDISDAGEVSARLVVDRVETLHMMQRDARTLERAFEQAGLKPSDGGVEITLRDPSDQSGFRQNQRDENAQRRSARISGGGDEVSPLTAQPVRRLARLGGVDLSI